MFLDSESRSGAGNLLTFLFGISVGVAGTLIYAAMNEEQFGRAVTRTKSLTDNVQDTLGDYLDEANTRIKTVADKAQDAVQSTVAKVKGKVGEVAGGAEQAAGQTQGQLDA